MKMNRIVGRYILVSQMISADRLAVCIKYYTALRNLPPAQYWDKAKIPPILPRQLICWKKLRKASNISRGKFRGLQYFMQ